ncbi:Ribosomal protein L11 methyltransferase [hydrothermal vent metagenome]|uniref:Ribosomal protein L11 methyltransferase n=1 Tax=hydrothermal vent metagenome TaxID=652676 RepID=A0A3B1B966_9ZZZZ
MPWLQLKFETDPQQAERLGELLETAGACAITMQDAADQPLFEPPPGATPLWKQILLNGLFEADADIEAILAEIAQALGQTPLPVWTLNPLEDKDWVRAWMDNYRPMCFGEKLWIVPSTFTPPDADAVNILLDPGLAFGTGTHPTTAMCLRWLDAHPPVDQTVIDYGCGSGILAIAACRLGAASALAVDNDPQALLATRDNACLNKVDDRIQAYLPDDSPAQTVPLLLANILAGPLHQLASAFAERVQPDGQIVLSGIIESQVEELIQSYSPWFAIKVYRQEEEWVCLHGQRNSLSAP